VTYIHHFRIALGPNALVCNPEKNIVQYGSIEVVITYPNIYEELDVDEQCLYCSIMVA